MDVATPPHDRSLLPRRRVARRVAVVVALVAANTVAGWSAVAAARTSGPDVVTVPVGAREEASTTTTTAAPRFRAQMLTDVAYGPDARHRMDVYLPEADEPRPWIAYFHGGAFMGGDKSDAVPTAIHQVSQGYAVVSVTYRLAPAHPFPAAIHDAKRAVRFVRAHAAEWGLDPDRAVTMGHSAGGNLAAMVALTDGDPGLEPPDLPPELAAVPSTVRGFVSLAGPLDLAAWIEPPYIMIGPAVHPYLACRAAPDCAPEELAAGSATNYMDAGDPPGYFAYGAGDLFVRFEDQGRAPYEQLVGAGVSGNVLERVATDPNAGGAGHYLDGEIDIGSLGRWLSRVSAPR